MKCKIWLVCLGCVLFAAQVASAGDLMDRFLDGVSSEDVLTEEEPVLTNLVNDYPGIVRFWGITNDVDFVPLLEAKVSSLANSGVTATNADERMRLSTAMLLLSEYNLTNSLPLFSMVVTNGTDESMVEEAAVYVGYGLGASPDLVRFLGSNGFVGMADSRVGAAQSGVFRGINYGKGDALATNRTISIALNCLKDSRTWRSGDCELTYVWPAYATSSNRYVAAQLALRADPLPASSNYLDRVIAELEALPPGTMQMLSTNHLGQAWQE